MEIPQQFHTARDSLGLMVITPHPLAHASINDTFESGGWVRITRGEEFFQRRSIAQAHQLVDPLFCHRRSASKFQYLEGNFVEKSHRVRQCAINVENDTAHGKFIHCASRSHAVVICCLRSSTDPSLRITRSAYLSRSLSESWLAIRASVSRAARPRCAATRSITALLPVMTTHTSSTRGSQLA